MEPTPLSLPGSSLSHSVSGWPCRSFLLSSCCRCWVCVVAPGCLGYCFLPLEGGCPAVAPLQMLSLPCALAPLALWVHCAVQLCAMATSAPPWAKALCCSLAVEAACLLARAAKQPLFFHFPMLFWCAQSEECNELTTCVHKGLAST